jgi:hypothetical protein
MRYIYLVLFLGVLIAPQRLWAQAGNSYGLSDNIETRIMGIESDYERMVQGSAPKFRLVRDVEEFLPIEGRTVAVPVNISDFDMRHINRDNSPPVIATLHDRRTGAPLDNCQAPCTLQSPMIPPGILTLYRYGSVPVHRGAEISAFLDPDDKIQLGFNEVDHQLERERCAMEFKVIRAAEPTREAEPCVRMPPLMPMEAKHSGHCKVGFNISRSGETLDVRAIECTEQEFCEASLAGVQRWIYYPKLNYGETEVRLDVRSKMSFRLTNHAGIVIPEPDGEMEPCVGSV